MKSNLLYILVSIAVLIFIMGSINWWNVGHHIDNIKAKISKKAELSNPKCNEIVKQLVPSKVEVQQMGNGYTVLRWNWKDGVESRHISFREAKNPDENVNHLYSFYESVDYKKQNVADDGTILEPVEITLRKVVLSPSSEKTKISHNAYRFTADVINYEVIDCKINGWTGFEEKPINEEPKAEDNPLTLVTVK